MKNLSLFKYKDHFIPIVLYQVISKLFLFCLIQPLLKFDDFIVELTNITALANLDFANFLMSIPFDLLMILNFLILATYVILDINCMILLSKSTIQNQKKNVFEIMKESFSIYKTYLNKKGVPLILFAFILCPIYICFYRHSLMEGLYLPDFIFVILNKMPLLYIPYLLIIVGIGMAIFPYSLALPYSILKEKNLEEAFSFSKQEIKSNTKAYIKRFFMLIMRYVFIWIVLFIVFGVIPFGFIYLFLSKSSLLEGCLTFVYWMDVILICLMKCLCPVYFTIDIAKMIDSKEPTKQNVHFGKIAIVAICSILIASITIQACGYFNVLFPVQKDTKIIAHKAGGKYANENTLEGLKISIEHNVYGAEIDVQRTKDGYYIVHHDDTFKRLCGVNKKSSDLTLEECRSLQVKDSYHSTPSQLATIEEILDTAKGKIHMFVELKGETADSQMAEDLYQMVVDRDMIQEVTFISLNYDVISGLETKHSDADTAFICYVALGSIEDIHCDKLLLENAMATSQIISKIHNANKEVYIWTVDSYQSIQERFLDNTDGIITNEVDRAIKVQKRVKTNKAMNRVFNELLDWR